MNVELESMISVFLGLYQRLAEYWKEPFQPHISRRQREQGRTERQTRAAYYVRGDALSHKHKLLLFTVRVNKSKNIHKTMATWPVVTAQPAIRWLEAGSQDRALGKGPPALLHPSPASSLALCPPDAPTLGSPSNSRSTEPPWSLLCSFQGFAPSTFSAQPCSLAPPSLPSSQLVPHNNYLLKT